MKRIKGIDDTPDRLSDFPDSLIHHIFSFLITRQVVKTTLLSKRWKDLWTTVPYLRFKEYNLDVVKFQNFVNRALRLWRGGHLRKFSIVSPAFVTSDARSDTDLWVVFAKDRKVEELRIERGRKVDIDNLYIPPPCLYECSSLRKLSLSFCEIEIHGNVQWDCLKTLKLFVCLFTEDVIEQVVSSSPQLETFSLTCNGECPSLNIRSSSLKKLYICVNERYTSNLMVLTIWAPNLEALKLLKVPFKMCLLTNVSSLTELQLEFSDYLESEVGEAFCRVLAAIHHVATVTVTVHSFKMFGVMKSKYSLLPLLNVKFLRICPIEFGELFGFLEIFPKLETLIIDWENSDGELSKFNAESLEAKIIQSNLLELRTAQIIWYSYEASIFEFLEFLLKHATMMEKTVIQNIPLEAVELEDMVLAAQKVVNLQRSFPNVELIFCRKW